MCLSTPCSRPLLSTLEMCDPSSLFPVCAITRARAHKPGEVVPLSDTFLADNTIEADSSVVPDSPMNCESTMLTTAADLTFSVDKTELIEAQQSDCTLASSLSASENKNERSVTYIFEDGVLMRRWSPVSGSEHDVV